LISVPTPVRRLAELERSLGLGSLWIKRDDSTCALYGGNKPRKLEWLVGAARQRRRRRLVTFGGLGTHHGLATAICGRDAGMGTDLVLLPQPVDEHVRKNLLLDRAYGADLHYASSPARAAATGLRLLAGAGLRGSPSALILPGGSTPLGTVGYVDAAFELAHQVACGELPEPDAIFVPVGSGGTAAGLVLGLKLAGLGTRVVGVLVSDVLPPSATQMALLARLCLRRLRRVDESLPAVRLRAEDFTVVRSQLGGGYGVPTASAREAARLVREDIGVELDLTYSAKCFAAIVAIGRSFDYRDRNVLFWNTYSSIDPATRVRSLPQPSEMPEPFRCFFEEPLSET
jgi:D-cysteine desulfhydrase